MNVSLHLANFHLHDGIIHFIEYFASEGKLNIRLTLCDWDGEFKEAEVFGKSGELIFWGVKTLKAAPNLGTISWNSPFGIRILDLEHRQEFDTAESEGVWGLFEFAEDGIYGGQKILEIQYNTTHFEWFPQSEM